MTKKELIADMQRAAGSSFVTRSWLAGYLHLKDPKSVDRYLYNLQTVSSRYFIADIAESIMQQSKYREWDHGQVH